MATTEQKLAAHGYSMHDAEEYVLAMVLMGQAKTLADKVLGLGLNAQDLAHIVGASKSEVIDYFNASGVDGNLLNAERTGFVFLLDLESNLYLSNPITGHNKWLTKFDRQVTDIATYKNGDIYVQSDTLLRYDFSSGKLEEMSPVQKNAMELAFQGDTLVRAVPGTDVLSYSTNFGANEVYKEVPLQFDSYFNSGSALDFADGLIYRNEKRTLEHPNSNFITEYNPATGYSKVVMSSDRNMDFGFEEVINADNEWILGYRYMEVQAYNRFTGETLELPYPFKVDKANPMPDTYVLGGSYVLQMHLDAWGIPI